MPAPPEALQAHHACTAFRCGRPALDDWLQRHALHAQGSGSARSFVVCEAGRVIAYYSLTVGQIEPAAAPDRIRQGMGRFPLPVVLLARLAVDGAYQGRGIGAALLRDAIRRSLIIAEQAGVRAMLVHPLDEHAARFYDACGFVPAPFGAGHRLLLLKDARRLMAQ